MSVTRNVTLSFVYKNTGTMSAYNVLAPKVGQFTTGPAESRQENCVMKYDSPLRVMPTWRHFW